MTNKSIGNDKTIGPDRKSGGHDYALKAGSQFGQYVDFQQRRLFQRG